MKHYPYFSSLLTRIALFSGLSLGLVVTDGWLKPSGGHDSLLLSLPLRGMIHDYFEVKLLPRS